MTDRAPPAIGRPMTAAEFCGAFEPPVFVVGGLLQRGSLYVLNGPASSGKDCCRTERRATRTITAVPTSLCVGDQWTIRVELCDHVNDYRSRSRDQDARSSAVFNKHTRNLDTSVRAFFAIVQNSKQWRTAHSFKFVWINSLHIPS